MRVPWARCPARRFSTLPALQFPSVPRFDFSSAVSAAEGLRYLDQNGYVVVQKALTDGEVSTAKSLFWDWAERLPPISRTDVKTWNAGWPGDPATGIISSHGIGQSDFLWFVRSRAGVRQAFAKLWNTNDLLTSFDGCGAFRPWRHDPSWRTNTGWWHVDQNPVTRLGRQCVQGLVSMLDGNSATGGLTVVPKSLAGFDEMGTRLARSDPELKSRGDYALVPASDPQLQTPGILVACRAGDLVLWDSRTIHCNCPGQLEPQNNAQTSKNNLIRLVAYVCMTPRALARPVDLEKRKNALKYGMSSSHWPHIFMENPLVGNEDPRARGPQTPSKYVDLTLV